MPQTLPQSCAGLGQGKLTNQSTQIATTRFFNGYVPAKKWIIVASIASPQSRDFKR